MGKTRRYGVKRGKWYFSQRHGLLALVAAVSLTLALTTLIPVSSAVWNDMLEVGGTVSLTPTATPLPLNSEQRIDDGSGQQGKKVKLAPVGDAPVPTEGPGTFPPKPTGGSAPPVAKTPVTSEPTQTSVPAALPTNTPAAQPSPKAAPSEVTDSIAPTPAPAAKPQK